MDELKNTPLPPDEDLTEVRKPTSLLIAQFFLFPLIIIGICLGMFLLFGYMTYDQKTAKDYVDAIRTGSGTQKWQAAFELSNLVMKDREHTHTPEFVESLSKAYTDSADEDIKVRGYIARILGEFKEHSVVPMLIEGVQREERLKTRDWPRDGMLSYFQPSLDQIHEELIQAQIYTLWALGSIGDNSAVPVVLDFSKNQEASVRKVAAYVLGVLKDERAVEQLRVLLNDPKDDVKWNAAIALAQLHDSESAELLMTLIDRSYVDALPDMTEDERIPLMSGAVTALGMLKYEPAKEKIRELSEKDVELKVRNAALEALKKY